MDYRWNEYQTPFEELHLEKYPDEVQEQFHDFMATVPYLQWLASADRPRAKDLPRDDKGRIIVDVAHPHILEDMDYFRPAALHYQQTGKYCDYVPNANPNSPFMKWFIEETRRCWYGYVRESDGEWIPGDLYFLWNYCPINLTEREEGKKRAKRVIGFPRAWEGHYLKFHYAEQARNNAHHGAELASRGKGKSLSASALLAKRFIMGEDEEVNQKVVSYITASEKKYLVQNGDQTLDKFEFIINFLAQRTELQWPKQRITSTLQNMQWQMGYRDVSTGTKMGTQNSVIGVSAKDDESKLRGTRGVLYILEEFGSFPRLSELYNNMRFSVEEGELVYGLIYAQGCVCAGTVVLDTDGKPMKIEDLSVGDRLLGYDGTETSEENITYLTPPVYKECVRIYTEKGNYIDCSIDHPLLTAEKYFGTITGAAFYRAGELRVGNTLLLPRRTGKFGNIHISYDTAFLLGALFGDGNYSGPECVTLSISSEEEYAYYNGHFDIGISKIRNSKNGIYSQIYFRNLHPLLKEHKMDGQAFGDKKLPEKIFEWDKESVSAFLSGYFNADGNIQVVKKKHRSIKLTCSYKDTLEQVRWLLMKYGINAHIYKESKPARVLHSSVNNRNYDMKPTTCYVLYISNAEDIVIFRENFKFLLKYKQERLDSYIPVKSKRKYYDVPFRLRENGKGKYYEGKNISDVYGVTVKKIEYLGKQRIYNLTANTTHTYITNGFISANTAGDSESDFQSAQEMVYNPRGYNLQTVPNVYDKKGQGRPEFTYFFPGYLNRAECYNKDGVSDVTKALLEILMDRYNVKYHSTKLSTITRRIAEYPVTPQEAMLKTARNMFPVSELNERLNQLLSDPHAMDNTYVGNLSMGSNGEVSFVPTSDTPITEFPLQDNKEAGALQIFLMPEKNLDGKVFPERYIIGVDPADNDEADTLSLYSIFVLDLWTDQIAAEYTGRYPLADDCHEMVRKLCLFYNAKALYEAHPYDQKVIMADGTVKEWGDVQIGDTLLSLNGEPTKVVGIPIDGEDDIYRFTLSDGRTVESSRSHKWKVQTIRREWKELTTEEIVNEGSHNKHGQHNFFIPESGGVDFPEREVPIDPYTLGLLIAEGAFTKFKKNRVRNRNRSHIQMSSSKEDMEFYRTVIPYPIKYIGTIGYSWHLYIDNIDKKLESLGLLHHNSHNKFIPELYLYNSRKVRLELLKGLMDGDGCANRQGASIFITTSRKLADDIILLARSLGFKALENKEKQPSTMTVDNVRVYNTARSYRVSIASEEKIFKLPRKIENQHVYRPYVTGSKASAILYKTAISKIEYVGKKRCKCVTVDRPDGLYLIGDYIVTHNCNIKGLYAYFKRMNCTHLLADTPEYLKDKDIIKTIGSGNSGKGVMATAAVNNYANSLIRDWLIKPVPIVEEDENGEVHERNISNLYRLKNIALIRELIAFNPEINVDRIRSLGEVMLYREEKMILYGGNPQSAKQEIEADYLGNDPFFTQNYDERFRIEEPVPYMNNKEVIDRLNEKI